MKKIQNLKSLIGLGLGIVAIVLCLLFWYANILEMILIIFALIASIMGLLLAGSDAKLVLNRANIKVEGGKKTFVVAEIVLAIAVCAFAIVFSLLSLFGG